MAKKRAKTGKGADEELVNFNTRLPDKLIIQMKLQCVLSKTRIQEFIRQAIEDRLKKLKSKK